MGGGKELKTLAIFRGISVGAASATPVLKGFNKELISEFRGECCSGTLGGPDFLEHPGCISPVSPFPLALTVAEVSENKLIFITR